MTKSDQFYTIVTNGTKNGIQIWEQKDLWLKSMRKMS